MSTAPDQKELLPLNGAVNTPTGVAAPLKTLIHSTTGELGVATKYLARRILLTASIILMQACSSSCAFEKRNATLTPADRLPVDIVL
jgi:hypothetical protein